MDARKRPLMILSSVSTFCFYVIDTVENGDVLLGAHIHNQALPLINYLKNYLIKKTDNRETVDVDILHHLETKLQSLSQVIWDLRIKSKNTNEDEDKTALIRALKILRLALKLRKTREELLKYTKLFHSALVDAQVLEEANGLWEDLGDGIGAKEDNQEDANVIWRELNSAFNTILEIEPALSKLVKSIEKAFDHAKKRSGSTMQALFRAGSSIKDNQALTDQLDWELLRQTAKPVSRAQCNFNPKAIVEAGSFGNLCGGSMFNEQVAFFYFDQDVLMDTVTTYGKSQLFGELVQERWANKFSHPAIIKFYGTVMLDRDFYFAMERMDYSLNVFLHGSTKPYRSPVQLTTDLVSDISRGIADGLNFLHSNQIVHKDLNPKNVFLGEANSLIKLAGFGTDRVVADLAFEEQEITYTAPEVLRDNEWTFAADIYSFGLIMWEMTQDNVFPYGDIEKPKLYKRVVEQGYRPEFVDDSILLSWFERLIKECWAPEPWLRPRAKGVLTFLNTKTKGGIQTKKRNVLGKSLQFMENLQTIPKSVKRVSEVSLMNTAEASTGRKKRRSTMRQSLSRLPSMVRNSTQRAHQFMDAVDLETNIGIGFKVVRYMELNMKDEEVQTRGCRAIKTFALNKGNEKPLMEMGAGIAVLNAMRTFPDSIEIAETGCGAICNLCFYDQGSKALMQRGAMPIIVNVMKTHVNEAEVLIEALQALVNLVHDEFDRKKAFLKFKAGELVVNIMRLHHGIYRIQEECCAAIVSLQDGFDDGGFFLLKAHELAFQAIEEFSIIPSLLSMAFLALKAMSVSPTGASAKERKEALERKKALVKLGVCEKVKTAMSSFEDDEDVIENALALIGSLAFNEASIPHIMNLSFAMYILDAMKFHATDEEIQMRGIWAIANLCYGKKWKGKVTKDNKFNKKETQKVI